MALFTKYNDPGHGWLKVPMALIDELGIRKQVSGYSYKSGDNAYLEEDCDAPLFDKAMQEDGRAFEVRHINCDKDSQIRRYPRFS